MELHAPVRGVPNTSAAMVADGANKFAFRLGAALAANAGGDNFICSPFSVWLPLAALVNATDEKYKDALISALNAAGAGEDDINEAASRLLYDLTGQDRKRYEKDYNIPYHDPLRIVNAVFVENKHELKKEFAQTYMNYYRGSVMNVDFLSDEAVDAINAWASENTDGLITEIVHQGFDINIASVLANAIYFSDRWDWEFDPASTTEDIFHSPSGDTMAFYLLREGNSQVYYEDDRVQALPLKFKTGGGLYVILPKDGDAAGLLSSMTNEYFLDIKSNSIITAGKLLLPRFSIESEIMELSGTLIDMGVPLFDNYNNPLTGLVLDDKLEHCLSKAFHKAIIMIDEKGTTAATVSVLSVTTAAAPIPDSAKPFEMICNKPFVFVLYGDTYDGGAQVLFTGVVNQP
jgi:serpin B